jgi:hypothetical protein
MLSPQPAVSDSSKERCATVKNWSEKARIFLVRKFGVKPAQYAVQVKVRRGRAIHASHMRRGRASHASHTLALTHLARTLSVALTQQPHTQTQQPHTPSILSPPAHLPSIRGDGEFGRRNEPQNQGILILIFILLHTNHENQCIAYYSLQIYFKNSSKSMYCLFFPPNQTFVHVAFVN